MFREAKRTVTQNRMTDVRVRPTPWKFQLQVLRALVLRDINSRFGNKRMGYIWALINPVLGVIALLVVFTVRQRGGPGALPMLVFIITGFPMFFGFSAMWNGINTNRTDGILMFPQVTMMDLTISKLILEFLTNSVVYLIIAIGFILILGLQLPADPINVLMCYWGCMWIGAGLGISNSAVRRVIPMIDVVLGPIRRLGIFISGVIFTATELPAYILPYFSWNPVFRCIEMARQSWYPNYLSPIYDPGYVVVVGIGLFGFGIITERFTRRYIDR
jgi:capsular polysaccharide transport system permease protein